MSRHQHTSDRSSRVAAELRKLRQSSGMSCEDVADRLGMPISKVRRLETGSVGIRSADIDAMLALYGVSEQRRAEVLAAARQSLRHTWWAQLAGQPRHWRSLLHLEAAATRLHDFQLYLLPCLLRTADYGRTVLGNGLARRSAEEVDRLVDLQSARQEALAKPDGPALHAVVDERVVGRLGRDEPMSRAQLRHLLAMSERQDVTLQVVPNSAGIHAGMQGSFTIMEYGDDTDVVYTEQLTTATYYQTRPDVTEYQEIMTSLLSCALSPAATRDFLCGLG